MAVNRQIAEALGGNFGILGARVGRNRLEVIGVTHVRQRVKTARATSNSGKELGESIERPDGFRGSKRGDKDISKIDSGSQMYPQGAKMVKLPDGSTAAFF